MKALSLHPWSVTPAEAREIQLRLRRRFEPGSRLPKIRLIAGADVALELRHPRATSSGQAVAGVIVYRFPEMTELERVFARRELTFPYIPGLLSFREIPALLAAFEQLQNTPELIFYDGHGYAHPRRFGIACHLGMLLECASVGIAKSRLVGRHREPALCAGSWTPLMDCVKETGERETIGAVVRTREGVKPVFVSQGHRVSLARAIELALAVSDGFRIPRPTREADHFVGAVKRGEWPPPRARHGKA
jgi:deoxyribonuclease V